ncbi:MAG: hypothetical protein GY811_18420 [Myxococcales bacterium]|nr:hypothetical protein [Myxococcales bacterium]
MQPRVREFEAKGAGLFVIGSGLPQYIEGFRDTTGYTGPVYTDPSLKVFEKAQLVRSVRATFGLRSVLHGLENLKKGHRQGKAQGDMLQQGGALVIAQDGTVLFAHQSNAGGDNVSPTALLSALERRGMAPPDSQ